jgi:hypothetical protein
MAGSGREGDMKTTPAEDDEVAFGPFANVPVKLIHPVGFDCPLCHKPVRKFGVQTPYGVPRMIFHTCACGPSVATWEDESQPGTAGRWRRIIKLARRAGVGLVMFNGNKDTPAGFQSFN